jgi:hypothetical protein
MSSDKLQLQRLEFKYIISEDTALMVRNFVSSYLELDEFGATQPNFSYAVHSLYLDSDDLQLYWQTINGNKNRYKLRLRFYENRPDAPVYFEIKRRMDNAIFKQRGAVHRAAVDLLLAGQLPEAENLVSKDPRHLVALQSFCQLMHLHQARPKAHVAYLREAWMPPMNVKDGPPNNSIRVTLDRLVRSEPEPTARLVPEMQNPCLVFGHKVVLELKFTGRFPDWFRDMVRVLQIRQCSAAKYVDGVTLQGESRFSPGYRPVTDPAARENTQARRENLQGQLGALSQLGLER